MCYDSVVVNLRRIIYLLCVTRLDVWSIGRPIWMCVLYHDGLVDFELPMVRCVLIRLLLSLDRKSVV